jgi:hypothetical protein
MASFVCVWGVCEISLPMMKGMVLKPPFLGLDDCSVIIWFEGFSMFSSATICSISTNLKKELCDIYTAVCVSQDRKRERERDRFQLSRRNLGRSLEHDSLSLLLSTEPNCISWDH